MTEFLKLIKIFPVHGQIHFHGPLVKGIKLVVNVVIQQIAIGLRTVRIT